jgi:hypothetical protein
LPHTLDEPRAQHPQARIRQARVHTEQGPDLGGREPLGMLPQQRHHALAHVAAVASHHQAALSHGKVYNWR